ncbi:WXG100 family type VII secretion target [Actinoplanes sp. NPDC051494]|uniref:WXG100 family type VII secretion target n=1 Tax=Actinoplanes sp. NPDC051494 TaxID=3363907 RepID=UPI00379D4F05
MSTSPLVAPVQDSTRWYTGLGLVEDAADITNGIQNNSWVDGSLGGVGASLDMLSLAVDPLGTLVSWGVSWLMEHVKPLKEALDWLAGNADEVASHAATWANVAAFTAQSRQEYADLLRTEVSGWFGASGDAYREHAGLQMQVLEGLSKAAEGISSAVEGAGLLVALVRGIVRDLIADFVGTLAVRLPQWLAAEGLTLGLATPVVVGQVTTLVATWVNRISGFIRGLLSSLRRLSPMLDRLAGIFEQLSGRNRALARTDPDEFKPHLPSGSEFVDGDFSPQVADAYRRIRDSPGDTRLAAENTGLDEAVLERMRQNLFVQKHDIATGPDTVEHGYFTPDGRLSGLWDKATSNTLTPAQREEFRMLAAHEYVENRLMEEGLPFRSPDPAVWDEDNVPWPSADHPSAHDLSVLEGVPKTPFRHWARWGIDSEGLEMDPDLGNLETVVDRVLRGLGR